MSSALYVKVYKFIYKLDMIFLKTKGRGPGGICVLIIDLFTQNHAILKTLIKRCFHFRKFSKICVRAFNPKQAGGVWRPNSSIFALAL